MVKHIYRLAVSGSIIATNITKQLPSEGDVIHLNHDNYIVETLKLEDKRAIIFISLESQVDVSQPRMYWRS